MFKIILFTIVLFFIYFFNGYFLNIYNSIFYTTKYSDYNEILDLSKNPIFSGSLNNDFIVKDKKGKNVVLTNIGSYDISGIILEHKIYKNSFSKCPFGDLPVGDLFIAFGDASKIENYNSLSVDMGYNGVNIEISDNKIRENIGIQYLQTHMTLNSLIASNKNIRNAIYSIKNEDKVRIIGNLINVNTESGSKFISSNGPDDFGQKLLGNPGSNEIIYVKEIIINNKKYN